MVHQRAISAPAAAEFFGQRKLRLDCPRVWSLASQVGTSRASCSTLSKKGGIPEIA
jgi:hypothetical protein